jgi:uncharacterized SAM-binding protein YcdF (DUF218 family)
MPRLPKSKGPVAEPSRKWFGFIWRSLLVTIFLVAGWVLWVTHQINQVAHEDQARPADAIAVFGAAEYRGRPSPVYHARLDHAVALYDKQIAPLVITLGGGSDKDSGQTEGGVGRDYLLANGVPMTDILAETNSFDTSQQVKRLVEISHARSLHSIVVVSDPTHLFRISVLCRDAGLDVYTSPRPSLGNIDGFDLAQRYAHEIISYTAFELHLPETALHNWIEGRD